MALLPKTRQEEVQVIMNRLLTLDVLRGFKELRHLNEGNYEVYLENVTITKTTMTNMGSYHEISEITLSRGGVKIDFKFIGLPIKTSE